MRSPSLATVLLDAGLLAALLGCAAAPAWAVDDTGTGTTADTDPDADTAKGVGLSLGVGVGGGSYVSAVTQLQVSRPLFFEASLGYTGGWDVGERYYPNLVVGLGMSGHFGNRPWRNGFFVDVASSLPAPFLQAWVAAGWSARIWGADDIRSFTLDVGLAAYLVRDLPAGTDLDQIPGFVHVRGVWHFPLIQRGGNTSERRPPRERKQKGEGDEAVAPVEAPTAG